ncbi:MAG: cellulase family glycosylhydrolase [Anaerolineae bacterium]
MYRRRTPTPLRALERLLEGRWTGWIINLVVIPALLLAALWLPPISLNERLLETGFVAIGPEGGAVVDPDGTQITIPSEGLRGAVKVRLTSIPRVTFLEGKAGRDLVEAAAAIPNQFLLMRSPYYRLEVHGTLPEQMVATIPIPNDSEPYSTLDLYAWDGEGWVWLPSHVIPEDDVIEARLDFVPPSLVVMQTLPAAPQIATAFPEGASLPEAARGVVAELNPPGLYLADDQGTIGGTGPALPPQAEIASFAIIPTITNWGPDGVVRSDLVDNLLVDPEARRRHAEALADLVVRNLWSGINVAYLDVSPDLRQEFTAFVNLLADQLHRSGKVLSITVGHPVQIAEDRWETGAYDWRALGQAADLLKVPGPLDPRTYRPGGQAEALLSWAVGEVNRYKLQLSFSTRSLEQVENVLVDLPLADALAPLAQIVGPSDRPVISAGEEVPLSLKGAVETGGVQFDEPSGLYWYAYAGGDGRQHVVWVESATSLAKKLRLASSFNLRGVALQHLLVDEQDGQVWQALQAYSSAGTPEARTEFTVRWEMRDASGQPVAQSVANLSDPRYVAVAPAPGEYTILAMLSTDGGRTFAGQSVARLIVATPTPVPTATPTPTPVPPTPTPKPPTPTPAPQATPKPQPKPTQAPQAAAPAPPNPGFGYGLQAHMIDNDQAPQVMAAIKDLGFGWVKQQVEWFRHEPAKGQYNWGAIDYLVDQANAAGVKVLLSVVKAPKWARSPTSDFSVEGPPANPQDYADFIGAMAARYRGRVHAYEIWNEQNMDYEWGREPFDAGRYVQILAAAYQAIKAQDPNAIVVSGALTPTGAPPPWAVDDFIYLEQMYQAGLKNYCDAVGAHPSGYNVPPDADWQTWSDPTAIFRGPSDNKHHSWSFKGTMEGYRNIMVKYGDGNKTIWPTEFGWASNPVPLEKYEYAADNTLEEQAQFTVRAFQMGKQWGWVGVMFLWNLNFKVVAPGSEMAQWGLVDEAWRPLPIYNALKAMPK